MSEVGLDDEQHSLIGHNLGIPLEQSEIVTPNQTPQQLQWQPPNIEQVVNNDLSQHPTSMNVVSLTPSMTVEETQTQPFANIKWTADNKFKYAFFAYGASIEGWKHCIPVMMVDATFLKSKYRGVLMIAVAKDGNNSIFPLAFGIADSENNESYRWFFRHVKKVFGTRKDLSILSDRHSSIATAIKELYPDTQHGICIYHMEKNLQKYFPSEVILSLFYNAATTYKQAEFRTYMSQIQQIDPKAAEYIEEEPPERWARSFHTNRRYNMLTTNNVETMNSVLRKAKELPIMACIDYIQNKLQNWFYQRKFDATGPSHDLTCWAEKILLEKISRGFTMKVENITPVKFVVKDERYQYNVDLKNMTCECLEFQTDELPCTHAMAVIDKRSLPKSTYCADWYNSFCRGKWQNKIGISKTTSW
ncbi:uncharacterized protein LOC132643753 [Lycium barbarum]|uniref:uncharacterized protein LOC132643753 n=1 Tax=Lycium barbarum TaxID=112863 RepID=UPI00293F0248|nr:uncharacterized protein LOC132643753 [Lycium barbarum]